MTFVRCNDMVQQVTATALHPALCYSVLPRTFEGCSDRSDFEGSNRCRNLHSILAITIKDQEPGSRFKWKRFPELLNDPQARWVLRDVEVQDPPTVMTDHEEAVEDTKRDRWNSEEIHRRNGFPVIAKKREPAFGWPGMPPLQYGQLLAEDKVLQEKVPTATTEAKERAEPEQKQVEHI